MKSLVALVIATCIAVALLGGVSVSGSPVGDAWEDDVNADNATTTANPTTSETPRETTPEVTTSMAPENTTTPEKSSSTPEVMSTAEHSSTPQSNASTPHSSGGTSPSHSMPSTSSAPATTTAAPSSKGFEVGSFFGGIATGLGVVIIIFIGYKLYSGRKTEGYKTM